MRYLHIMTVPSFIYNEMIIKMINNEEGFDSSEHEFIFTNQYSYNISKQYFNVKLDEKFLDSRLKKINSMSYNYDYIFIHGLYFTWNQFLFLNDNTARKIIWCVWGSDLYNRRAKSTKDLNLHRKIRKFATNILFYVAELYKVRKFSLIAIGFMYDKLEIKRLYGEDIRIGNAPYGLGYEFEKVNKVINEYKINDINKPVKIMIGHSAYPFLNHKYLLGKLEKYKDENILISIPLNYGDNAYAKQIEELAIKIYGYKVEILKNYMESDEYLKYLMTVDIAIFDYTHQAALANIYLLLYMGKKLFLNSGGIIYKGMTNEHVKVFQVEDINKLHYNEFIENEFEHKNGKKFGKLMLDESIIISKWKALIDKLRSESF